MRSPKQIFAVYAPARHRETFEKKSADAYTRSNEINMHQLIGLQFRAVLLPLPLALPGTNQSSTAAVIPQPRRTTPSRSSLSRAENLKLFGFPAARI
jgi:hypothetical protein